MACILYFLMFFRSSANLPEFSKDARMLAALEDEGNDGDRLLDAARRLAGAFSDLLTAAQPDNQEVRLLITAHTKFIHEYQNRAFIEHDGRVGSLSDI